jgi:antitoxin ParD1/3/4
MLSVTIPAEFEQFVQGQLACGAYHSTEEMLSDALKLLRQRDLELLRQEVQVGIDELDRGEGILIEDERALKDFFDGIEEEGRKELQAERERN